MTGRGSLIVLHPSKNDAYAFQNARKRGIRGRRFLGSDHGPQIEGWCVSFSLVSRCARRAEAEGASIVSWNRGAELNVDEILPVLPHSVLCLTCTNFEQQFYPTEVGSRDVGKGAPGALLSHDLIKHRTAPDSRPFLPSSLVLTIIYTYGYFNHICPSPQIHASSFALVVLVALNSCVTKASVDTTTSRQQNIKI